MKDIQLDHDATTRLVTAITYLGAGPESREELQRRLDSIAGDDRLVVGEIDLDSEGRPVCGISFNCDSYEPPVEGRPDPKAIEDLRAILDGVNTDRCLFWSPVELLLEPQPA